MRNFYFFRRNYYPQLSLVQMETKEALRILEKTVNIQFRIILEKFNYQLTMNLFQGIQLKSLRTE